MVFEIQTLLHKYLHAYKQEKFPRCVLGCELQILQGQPVPLIENQKNLTVLDFLAHRIL